MQAPVEIDTVIGSRSNKMPALIIIDQENKFDSCASLKTFHKCPFIDTPKNLSVSKDNSMCV